MASTQLTSRVPASGEPSSSQSSSSNLSGGTIAAIVTGTILAVGLVCFLLFYPQFLFAWLMKSRARNRPLGTTNIPLRARLPQHPGQASGNDGSSNGADDAGSRRRRPEIVRGGNARAQGNNIVINRPPGSPVIINNNIYVSSDDYLHPLPALTSPRNRNRGPAPPAAGVPHNARPVSRNRRAPFRDPSSGGIRPQRIRRGEPSAPPPRTSTGGSSETSSFWDVGDWARSVASAHIPPSSARGRTRSPLGRTGRSPIPQADRNAPRERALNVPGAFPEEKEVVERFQLVTAPARVHASGAPSHGDDGFWVREGRENRWRRQEREERRDRQEREDRQERLEREERRERERVEREDRWERREREERRERWDGRV